jgi:GNAT superfamily N-acetyltransferase
MIHRLDLTHQAATLLEVQRAAYRLEAELIGFADIPPLHETLDELRASAEIFYGYWIGAALGGAISYQLSADHTLDIHRLVVNPAYLRRGIGRALVQALPTLEPTALCLIVATGALNTPARRLYEQAGFVLVREWEAQAGLCLVAYRKTL